MPRHIELGKKGEELAVAWLSDKGYKILHTNWRYRRYEIDIIAHRKAILHFIEIKTRNSRRYGYPEESVSPKKIKDMMQGAMGWIHRYPHTGRVQYDVLAISLKKDKTPEFFFFEDVYL